jgi:hypothetical protein
VKRALVPAIALLLGCTHTVGATFQSRGENSVPRATLGKPIDTPAVDGQIQTFGDVERVKAATRVVVLLGRPSRRGSASRWTTALEAVILRAGKVPVLPAALPDAPAGAAVAEELDVRRTLRQGTFSAESGTITFDPSESDIERALELGVAGGAELILQFTETQVAETLFVPCQGGVMCPASLLTGRAFGYQEDCIPNGAYPVGNLVSTSVRAIEPGTGRVIAVLTAAKVIDVAAIRRFDVREGGKSLCSWQATRPDQPMSGADGADTVLALIGEAIAKTGTSGPLPAAPPPIPRPVKRAPTAPPPPKIEEPAPPPKPGDKKPDKKKPGTR